jgi:hypothetical protein
VADPHRLSECDDRDCLTTGDYAERGGDGECDYYSESMPEESERDDES